MKTLLSKYQSVFFPIFDIALNGANYFFHIFISWYLLPKQYGVLNSLLSIAAILMVTGISLQTFTAKSIAASMDETVPGFKSLKGTSEFFIAGIGVVYLLLLGAVIGLTHGSCLGGIVVLLIFILNAVLSIVRGVFQGKKQFLRLNCSFYIEVISKIIFLFVVLPIAPSVETCLFSILVGMGCSLLHAVYMERKQIHLVLGFEKPDRDEIKQVSAIYLSNLFLCAFTSIDMILVNYFLPDQAGVFAVVIRYSQIMLFVAFSMMTVFIPYLSASKTNGPLFKKRIRNYLGLMLIVGMAGLLGYAFILPMTVVMFFGQQYALAANYLFFGAVAYLFLMLSFYMVNVFIVLNNKKYIVYLLTILCMMVWVLLLYHDSLWMILGIEIGAFASLFLCLLIHVKFLEVKHE